MVRSVSNLCSLSALPSLFATRLAGSGQADARRIDDASDTATVVEVRAHDAPGLLWRVGRALGECGLDVRAARVETLGAEVVDVFYVTDGDGKPVAADDLRRAIVHSVLASLAD